MFNESEVLFEDLYNPDLVRFYQIFWTISFSYTTVYFVLMIYIIIKKSNHEMGGYKWYLVHQMSWIFLFDLHMSIWKPIPLWPFYLIYSSGFWGQIPTDFSFIPAILLASTCCGMGFSIYISAMHRYVQAAPFSWFYRQYSNVYLRFPVYVVIFIAVQLIIMIPIILLKIPPEMLQEQVLKTAPQLESFFQHESSIFGYHRSVKMQVTTFTYVVIGVIGALIFSIIALTLNYVRIMRNNKNSLEHGTLRCQKMLLKSLFIQVSLTVIILILPLTLCLIFCTIGFKWTSKFSICAIMFMSLHAIVEFTCTIICIKPYREYAKTKIKSIRTTLSIFKCGRKPATFIMVTKCKMTIIKGRHKQTRASQLLNVQSSAP